MNPSTNLSVLASVSVLSRLRLSVRVVFSTRPLCRALRNSWEPRASRLILWCILVGLTRSRLILLRAREFESRLTTLVTVRSSADPFVLPCFSIVTCLFGVTPKLPIARVGTGVLLVHPNRVRPNLQLLCISGKRICPSFLVRLIGTRTTWRKFRKVIPVRR